MSKNNKKTVVSLIGIAAVIIAAVVTALLLKEFVLSPMLVRGKSMQPYLYEKDTVLVLKCGYNLDYGDCVVFERDKHTKEEDSVVFPVKRIIGLPGDTIEIKGGNIYRNGVLLDESAYHVEGGTTFAEYEYSDRLIRVKSDCLFVCGDNRAVSYDSRYYGTISMEKVVGKVIAVY